jgi:hypothetical protein
MKTLALGALTAAALVVTAVPSQAAPPTQGTCFSYSADQWLQGEFTAGLIDCATSHNGEVLGLVTVPADIEASGYGSAVMKGWAFTACQDVAVQYVWSGSGRYRKSSYVLPRTARLNVQLPTGQQWAEGERWAACLGQSRNVKLTAAANRTGSVRGQGLKPYVCYSTRNWKGAKCGKPDAVRMTQQVWLPSGYDMDYPGSDKLLSRTRKACQKMLKRKDQLRTWFVPGLSAWDRGNRYGFCQIGK